MNKKDIRSNDNGRINWKRVFVAMFLIVGVFSGADMVKRSLSNTSNTHIISSPDIPHNDRKISESDNPDQLSNESTSEAATGSSTGLGEFEHFALEEQLGKGLLCVYTADAPALNSQSEDMVNLKNTVNDCYSLYDSEADVYLDSSAAEALNSMMQDYNRATGLSDFLVYGTTSGYKGEGSLCPDSFPDSPSGLTVDLALRGYAGDISYDGEDEQGWIVNNCHKYGFIVRYPKGKKTETGYDYCPWYLRYVGKEHAAVMNINGFSLEEYIEFLKGYSYDSPFVFSSDVNTYTVYTFASKGETTYYTVPGSESYTISGDNKNTYIVTYKKAK